MKIYRPDNTELKTNVVREANMLRLAAMVLDKKAIKMSRVTLFQIALGGKVDGVNITNVLSDIDAWMAASGIILLDMVRYDVVYLISRNHFMKEIMRGVDYQLTKEEIEHYSKGVSPCTYYDDLADGD